MSLSLTTVNNLPWDNITNRILEIVAGAPGCEIAAVVELLPDVSLGEVVYGSRVKTIICEGGLMRLALYRERRCSHVLLFLLLP